MMEIDRCYRDLPMMWVVKIFGDIWLNDPLRMFSHQLWGLLRGDNGNSS